MNPENNFLYLIWKDPQSRRNYTIGKLSRGDKFFFEYCDEFAEAEKHGWSRLEVFPENRRYESETLFSVFSSRLPDRKRRDIDKILKKYGLESFDEYDLLRKSGARLPIDTYSFIDPIFPDEETIDREFYVMGVRHHAACQGNDCALLSESLRIGDRLTLKRDPDNPHDPNAIRIYTAQKELLGYVPRYYTAAILERLDKGLSYDCRVSDINQALDCAECVKVRLQMPKKDASESD